MKNFTSEAAALAERLTEIRRDLHRHPELGFQEHRTAGIVAEILEKAGIEIRRGVKIHKKTGSRSIPCRNTCTTQRQSERL
jgi:metal-dependent amidase/aminoacylase/carboxypeptidase family protein